MMQRRNHQYWQVSEIGTIEMKSDSEALKKGSVSGHSFRLIGKTVSQKIIVQKDDTEIPEDRKTYYSFSCLIKKKEPRNCKNKVI